MKIKVLLFAGIRDAYGSEWIELVVGEPVTAGDVIEAVATAIAGSAELVRFSRLAVDGDYVGPEHPLADSAAELALIPPVSGG